MLRFCPSSELTALWKQRHQRTHPAPFSAPSQSKTAAAEAAAATSPSQKRVHAWFVPASSTPVPMMEGHIKRSSSGKFSMRDLPDVPAASGMGTSPSSRTMGSSAGTYGAVGGGVGGSGDAGGAAASAGLSDGEIRAKITRFLPQLELLYFPHWRLATAVSHTLQKIALEGDSPLVEECVVDAFVASILRHALSGEVNQVRSRSGVVVVVVVVVVSSCLKGVWVLVVARLRPCGSSGLHSGDHPGFHRSSPPVHDGSHASPSGECHGWRDPAHAPDDAARAVRAIVTCDETCVCGAVVSCCHYLPHPPCMQPPTLNLLGHRRYFGRCSFTATPVLTTHPCPVLSCAHVTRRARRGWHCRVEALCVTLLTHTSSGIRELGFRLAAALAKDGSGDADRHGGAVPSQPASSGRSRGGFIPTTSSGARMAGATAEVEEHTVRGHKATSLWSLLHNQEATILNRARARLEHHCSVHKVTTVKWPTSDDAGSGGGGGSRGGSAVPGRLSTVSIRGISRSATASSSAGTVDSFIENPDKVWWMVRTELIKCCLRRLSVATIGAAR